MLLGRYAYVFQSYCLLLQSTYLFYPEILVVLSSVITLSIVMFCMHVIQNTQKTRSSTFIESQVQILFIAARYHSSSMSPWCAARHITVNRIFIVKSYIQKQNEICIKSGVLAGDIAFW